MVNIFWQVASELTTAVDVEAGAEVVRTAVEVKVLAVADAERVAVAEPVLVEPEQRLLSTLEEYWY